MIRNASSTVAFRRRPPRGMTLVELLVVTGLITVFLGLVVTGVRGGRQVQKGRAESLASALAAVQSRSLNVPEGAALILVPDAAATTACTTLFEGVMQPLIEATVTGVPPTPPSATSATASVSPTNGGDVRRAYRILLGGSSSSVVVPPAAWLGFTATSVSTGSVSFRAPGQTTANTVWPKAPASGTSAALLAQYPSWSSTPIPLDEGAAVDLRFSGIGDDRSQSAGRLDGKGSIAVVFDRTGRVAEVISQVPAPGAENSSATQPEIRPGILYLLVAPRDVISSGANSLASADATWVALATQTGQIFMAANVPQANDDDTALRAARARVRQGLGATQ